MKAMAKAKKGELRAAKGASEAKMALRDGAKALRDLADSLATGLLEQARQAGLDDRAEDLAKRAEDLAIRVRDAEATQLAMGRARRLSKDGMDRLGGWLATGKRAEMLGVQPARRSWRPWLAAGIGLAVGYVLGAMTAPKRGEELREDLSEGMEHLREEAADHVASALHKPVAEAVRTRLGEDPRTSEIAGLDINVADGTVFVRGSVPREADEEAIRAVVTAVPGVSDVDLQVTVST